MAPTLNLSPNPNPDPDSSPNPNPSPSRKPNPNLNPALTRTATRSPPPTLIPSLTWRLQAQIRAERRQRRKLERAISEPALTAGGGARDAPAGRAAAVPDAWFEERDAHGRTLYIHLDGKRTTRERPTEGKVYGFLSYGMFGPELGTPFFGNDGQSLVPS